MGIKGPSQLLFCCFSKIKNFFFVVLSNWVSVAWKKEWVLMNNSKLCPNFTIAAAFSFIVPFGYFRLPFLVTFIRLSILVLFFVYLYFTLLKRVVLLGPLYLLNTIT